MSNGYIRQSAGTIITGNTVQASDFNNEYNALQSAFDGSTGHNHSGGSGLGPQLALTTAVTGILPAANGGTGVANSNTITLGGNLTLSGAYAATLTLTNTTSLTLPTSGTLLSTASSIQYANIQNVAASSLLGNPTGSPAAPSEITLASGLSFSGTTLAISAGGVTNTMLAGSIAASKLVLTDITTLSNLVSIGTITTGTWTGTTIAIANGGTGATSASAARTGLGLAIGTNVEAWSATLDAVAAGTYTGASSITTLGTIATGVWNGTAITGQYGGTGVANTGKTLTLGGSVTYSGANTVTWTTSGTTTLTLPGSGTVLSDSSTATLTNKTFDTAGTGNSLKINGTSVSAVTGTGSVVLSASPTFTGTPTLPTGTIATTQSPGDNSTKVATTAFVTAAAVAQVGFGSWTNKTVATVYQAATDGFVVGYGASSNTITIYTDGSNPPTTARMLTDPFYGASGGGFCCPVRKNDYYEVTSGGTVTMFFISLGS